MTKVKMMPLYVDEFIGDTDGLDPWDRGMYLLLLVYMWKREDDLPDNDAEIARTLGITRGTWVKLRGRLSRFLLCDGATVSQKKLRKLFEKGRELALLRAHVGTAGNEVKKRRKLLITNNVPPAIANALAGSDSLAIAGGLRPLLNTKDLNKKEPPKSSTEAPEPEEDAGDDDVDLLQAVWNAVGYQGDLPNRGYWSPLRAMPVLAMWRQTLEPAQILERAAKSRETYPVPPDGPMALNQSMSDMSKKLPNVPNPEEREKHLLWLAEKLNGDGFCSPNMINNTQRAALIGRGLVTEERLRERGINA